MKLRIGTRKSDLAQTQSSFVMAILKSRGLDGELVFIESSGDRDRKTPLYETGGFSPGVFTKELEEALLKNRIDLAIHSLKDLPTQCPDGLKVAAVGFRENAGDSLLINPLAADSSITLGIALNAKVGTSSLRREAQLLAVRPDLKVQSLRGNVPTRVKKAISGDFSGVVLANAGLKRLNLDLSKVVRVELPPDQFIGAPGQGALALETRVELPSPLAAHLSELNDEKAAAETGLERKLLRELEGGCTLPFGARAKGLGNGLFILWAFLGILEEEKGQRTWKSFERFHGEGSQENLLKEAMAFFRGRMK